MEYISTLLQNEKNRNNYSNIDISYGTNINTSTISKHMNGARNVSQSDLNQYCKFFQLSFNSIVKEYSLDKHDICKQGTLKTILATMAGVGAGAVVYHTVKTMINDNCRKI